MSFQLIYEAYNKGSSKKEMKTQKQFEEKPFKGENQSDFVIRTGCQKCDEFLSFPFSFFDEKLKKSKILDLLKRNDF